MTTSKEEYLLYTERTTAAAAAAAQDGAAREMTARSDAVCREMDGRLPKGCGNMVFPYIAMQREDAQRYENREALLQGTLFPGLDLPFRKELRSRFPKVNEALLELMALDFAIDELGLYLTTHPNDQQALELYWSYIRLGREGRAKYEEANGPLLQTDITEGSFRWLDDPWPWDKGGND